MEQDKSISMTIRIDEEVFVKLITKEVLSVKGVYAIGKGKGVRAQLEDSIVSADVHIVVRFGSRIPDVAWQIQERVKKTLEDATGYTVAAVNVHVDAIRFPEEPEDTAIN